MTRNERCIIKILDYDNISGIYVILNIITWKLYIGSSVNVARRLCRHLYLLRAADHYNDHLQQSFLLYGENSFEFFLLEETPKESLIDTEQQWFNETQCYEPNKGYNICKIAYSVLGMKHTNKSRALMSEVQKQSYIDGRVPYMLGKRHLVQTRTKMAQKALGRICSQQTRILLSESHKGIYVSDVTREKLRIAGLGRMHSTATKKKLQSINRGKKLSTDTRNEISKALRQSYVNGRIHPLLGKTHSDETKSKISKALSGRTASEKTISKASRDWLIINPHGGCFYIRNLAAFCREHNLSRAAMGLVADGKQSTHKNWLCQRHY